MSGGEIETSYTTANSCYFIFMPKHIVVNYISLFEVRLPVDAVKFVSIEPQISERDIEWR